MSRLRVRNVPAATFPRRTNPADVTAHARQDYSAYSDSSRVAFSRSTLAISASSPSAAMNSFASGMDW